VVSLPLKAQHTHKIHPSWVTLSKEGTMGVMAIEQGLSVFYPVSIVDSSPSHLYVMGLPDQIEIITLGQETVAVGNRIQSSLTPARKEKRYEVSY